MKCQGQSADQQQSLLNALCGDIQKFGSLNIGLSFGYINGFANFYKSHCVEVLNYNSNL